MSNPHWKLLPGVPSTKLFAMPCLRFIGRLLVPYLYQAIIVFMDTERLSISIKQRAADLGFDLVGIVAAKPGRRLAAYHRWLANRFHGEMTYLARSDRLERRANLNQILPDIQSIVCVGLDYSTQTIPQEILTDPSRGRVSNYAWGRDYHQVMEPRLQEIAEWLKGETQEKVTTKVYVDTGAIMERDHGESAGLGFIGKNTMLIHPRRGSWFFLGELLTTVKLEPDEIRDLPNCGRCNRCLVACPTNAFPEPYVLDARRCISYLTIEFKGWIPQELRPLTGNWVYGCDICQEVCPFNRFATPTKLTTFRADDWDRAAPPLMELLAIDENDFNERFEDSPIKRIKRTRLVRNACVAAGNWGSKEALPGLIPLLKDEEAIIRGHAAWALQRIGGQEAKAAIQKARIRESDNRVLLEMA